MKRKDFELLKKVLKRTEDGADENDMLTALRMANVILKRNDVTWERFLNFLVRVDVEEDPERKGQAVRPPPRPSPQNAHFGPDDLEDDPAPREPGDRNASGLDQATVNAIEAAFRRLEAVDAWTNFTKSLKAQWDERGSLSAAQLEHLWKHEARSYRQ